MGRIGDLATVLDATDDTHQLRQKFVARIVVFRLGNGMSSAGARQNHGVFLIRVEFRAIRDADYLRFRLAVDIAEALEALIAQQDVPLRQDMFAKGAEIGEVRLAQIVDLEDSAALLGNADDIGANGVGRRLDKFALGHFVGGSGRCDGCDKVWCV
ncbi:hypothetical protein [Neorhizobium sp. SHOUNA12B]|uniref:hypothetical protein n=1 Tax=Neorhizobium sp. SHOUNA12B TaxID=2908928 RepID=UPI0025ED997B|nr:hypothetical protein [Neorhizobium sp. SHOUNA12B]MCJ9748031.1 hypothetical protein [Neorhizobium sp. SHOUNA12A]